MTRRPMSVTAAGAASVVGGLFAVLVSVAFLHLGGVFELGIDLGVAPAGSESSMTVLGYIVGALGILSVIGGVGAYSSSSWAWTLSVLSWGATAIALLVTLIVADFLPVTIYALLVGGAFALLTIGYLYTHEARDAMCHVTGTLRRHCPTGIPTA